MALIIPGNGEVWQAGSLHYLAWDGAADAAVEYSLTGGDSWRAIESDGTDRLPPRDERFAAPPLSRVLWKTPNHPGAACRFRVRPPGGSVEAASVGEIRIAPSAERRYRWELVTPEAPFAPRDGGGALTFNGRVWLLGGWNPTDQARFPNDCNSEVWASPDGRDWQLMNPAAPWEKRHTAGYVTHRGRMWVVGGDPIQGHYQGDVWSSADGVRWTQATARAPWGDRILHHTVAHRDRIWVMGGQKVSSRVKGHLPNWAAPADEVFHNDVWCSEDGANWTRVLEHAPWEPRGLIGGSAVKDGFIWLLGGGHYYEQYYPEVWRSADGVNWDRVSAMTPWYPRTYHDVAVYDDRLWVMEGLSKPTGNRNDVWYSTDGSSWYEVADAPWPSRHAASVFVHGGALWMMAGNQSGATCRNDVWRLVPA